MAEVEMSEYRELFIEEVQEHLQDLNRVLLQLEKEDSNPETLNSMFRSAHTIKGMAATMGYDDMAHLAHAMENLLGELRQGTLEVRAELFDLLFECLDALDVMQESVVAGRKCRVDLEGIAGRLEAYQMPGGPPVVPKEVAAPAEVVRRPARALPEWVRINVKRLDSLLTLVEELVINRSWLTQIHAQYDIPALKEALEQQERILADLRETVLNARMVPVAQVFNRFPRMVRDLLKQEGKEAELIIEGQEIELDRAILEQISDPLVHLLRNAVDHGMEPPEERERAGKPRVGTIRLTAWRERDQVIVEVSDDGRGMDPKRIAETAAARGLVTLEEAKGMSEQEILTLICHPRFSMAAEITRVSGRGVGMDVVRRTVESLRGSLEITSTPGMGSTFRLRLPLTLAIVKALLVGVGAEIYAIPCSYIERTVAVMPCQIKPIERHEVIMLDEAIPILRLGEFLHVPGGDAEPCYVVVVGRDHQRMGLLVNALIGQEEIVVRALPGLLGRIRELAGATISGGGEVILILDVPHLV